MALTLRSTKGSALSHAEMDANFSGLADGSLITLPNGSGTLAVTFVTPGTSSFVATENTYSYTEIAVREIVFRFDVVGTITIGTASGILKLTGVPFTNANVTSNYAIGAAVWGDNMTKTGYTQLQSVIVPGENTVKFLWSGAGVPAAFVAAADIVTGSTLRLTGQITFHI